VIFRFTHLSGANANHVDTVEAAPITLGRDDLCHVRFDRLKDLAVSGHHAQIEEVSEGTYRIANLSKNGLLVNGVPCDTTAKLPNHATIQLGKDGPRIRFDVDQHIGGVSKTDVQRKAHTKKLVKNQVMREKAPTTEERPVFQVEGLTVEKPAAEAEPISKLLIVAIVAGILAVILGAILILK
jgi:pSer/pThr/pTyr-binding forkhead associated (FHA) protein